MLAREEHHLYNRMAIERLIYTRSAMRGLTQRAESWYDEHSIDVLLNTRAARINRVGQQVLLATGETLPYDRLILATGSSSVRPPIDGIRRPGAFVLREANDALAIRAYAQQHRCREAMVAGGGLLGLEAALALQKLGLRVSVLERGAWLLPRQLDQHGAALLRRFLEKLGIPVILGAEIVAVGGPGRTTAVVLKDGGALPADLLVVCAGIAPNVELARDAGLAIGRGVVVDDGMRTSDPHVFACGDVAEHRGAVYGLWPVAAAQAEVAAANALGSEQRYQPVPPATTLKVVGVDLTSIGRIQPTTADETVVALDGESASQYRRLVIDDGRIVGAILLGFPHLSAAVSSAIARRTDVRSMLSDLHAGRWDGLADLADGTDAEREDASALRLAA
jgi:NAD(P)H-nitrite reductase large subunit